MTATVEIDMYKIIANLTDAERLEWIKNLVETIEKSGTIERARSIINSDSYDD